MATGFTPDGGSLIPFGVDMSEGSTLLPLPVLGEDRIRLWSASIILANNTDAEALKGEQVSVTSRPAIGGMDHGTLLIEGTNTSGAIGRFGNLRIPVDMDGTEQVWRAALSSCVLSVEGTSIIRRAQVEFVVGNRVS